MARNKKKKYTRLQKVCKWINITLWTGFFTVLLLIVGIFYAIAQGYIGFMPPIEQLENPIDRYASQIISSDGVTIGTYHISEENRIQVQYSDLSPALVQALIATEDNRFTKHSGIDIKGLTRAVIKWVFANQRSGGSTITQQLAKQLFTPRAGNITERILQKPIEWVIAVQLERYYTKEEIINLYLNKFDFNYSAIGIESAARAYFNTTPKNLTIEQAATLIGMCKNPTYYNPVRYTERALGRRNTVLMQMNKYNYLSKAVCDSLCALPVEMEKFTRPDHKEGPAPYLRVNLQLMLSAKKPDRSNYRYAWQQQKFVEDSIAWETNPLYGWCNKTQKPNGENYNIYTDGLKIYTTIDSRMQQYAEEAVREHIGKEIQPAFSRLIRGRRFAPFTFLDITDREREIKVKDIMDSAIRLTERYQTMRKAEASDEEITTAFNTKTEMTVYSWNGAIDTIMTPYDSIRYMKSFLRVGFMAMDSRTGHVKAYVGGIDFTNFQYDAVNARRQIGSTMKPFVYSLAMIKGFTPCDRMLHVEQTLRDENGIPWIPKNSTTYRIGEMITIREGLQQSSNWVTAYLMNELSPYALERLLRSYGFKGTIEPVISMCLGTPDISVAEMVSAYSVFTNKGMRLEPMYVTHIEDSYGNTVATFTIQPQEVLTEDATYKVLNMLQAVVDNGTAARVRAMGITAEMGGKTGTTQNQSDAWYMGFTPNLIAGCWVGGEDRSIHFDTMEGQGARVALPVYAIFMRKVLADKDLDYSEQDTFDIPDEYKDPCSTISGRSQNNNTQRQRSSGFDAF